MIERYRHWFEHEKDANDKMLGMIEAVPEGKRDTPEFKRALQLADHLAVARENWLIRMAGRDDKESAWWQKDPQLDSLRPRFARLEADWTSYLESINDEDLAKEFDFYREDGSGYRWGIEEQIVQLVGHAFYHRGQIAQLVYGLGVETPDTDYLYWEFDRNPRFFRHEKR